MILVVLLVVIYLLELFSATRNIAEELYFQRFLRIDGHYKQHLLQFNWQQIKFNLSKIVIKFIECSAKPLAKFTTSQLIKDLINQQIAKFMIHNSIYAIALILCIKTYRLINKYLVNTKICAPKLNIIDSTIMTVSMRLLDKKKNENKQSYLKAHICNIIFITFFAKKVCIFHQMKGVFFCLRFFDIPELSVSDIQIHIKFNFFKYKL